MASCDNWIPKTGQNNGVAVPWLMALALLLGAAGSSADAGIVVQLDAGSPTASNPFTFSYTASILGSEVIRPDDFFTIYDFAGLTGVPTAPSGWSVSVEDTDPNPLGVLSHGDNPAIPNITFTFEGTGASLPGPVTISGFTAESTFSATTIKDFVGIDNPNEQGVLGGKVVVGSGNITVPAATPEPASLTLLGLGGLGLAGYGWRRRKQSVAA